MSGSSHGQLWGISRPGSAAQPVKPSHFKALVLVSGGLTYRVLETRSSTEGVTNLASTRRSVDQRGLDGSGHGNGQP